MIHICYLFIHTKENESEVLPLLYILLPLFSKIMRNIYGAIPLCTHFSNIAIAVFVFYLWFLVKLSHLYLFLIFDMISYLLSFISISRAISLFLAFKIYSFKFSFNFAIAHSGKKMITVWGAIQKNELINVQSQNKKLRKVLNSENFCFRNIWRAITKWGEVQCWYRNIGKTNTLTRHQRLFRISRALVIRASYS